MKFFIAFVVASLFACACCSPISDTEDVDSFFNPYSDVRLLLSTRANLDNPVQLRFRDLTSVLQSPFNRDRPLRVLIHGWTEGATSDIKVETSRELLALYDFNILFVDWSEGASTITYLQARQRVQPVGEFLASYLDFLHENAFIDFNRVSITGFSLGAHMAGIAGKLVRRGRINTIIGLDPAGSLFSVNTPAERLAVGDADYVECLHTNGGAFGFGIGAPIGNADFFPNGGSVQPGCILNSCSHLRAVDLFIESVATNSFFSNRCTSQTQAFLGLCTDSAQGAWFGGEPSNFNFALSGIFHFATNNAAPFALGTPRPF